MQVPLLMGVIRFVMQHRLIQVSIAGEKTGDSIANKRMSDLRNAVTQQRGITAGDPSTCSDG